MSVTDNKKTIKVIKDYVAPQVTHFTITSDNSFLVTSKKPTVDAENSKEEKWTDEHMINADFWK